MTENNKLFDAKISELLEALQNEKELKSKINNNELEALEKAIFTKNNLKNITANKGTDLSNFLNGIIEIGNINDTTIEDTSIINNGHMLANDLLYKVLQNTYNASFEDNGKIYSTNNFGIDFNNNHFTTVKIKKENGKIEEKEIFNSLDDGRQFGNCCGIHAIEGVLIAEELTKEGKNIEDFKNKVKKGEFKLTKTSNEDLLGQRKILFKMEILDALNNANNIVLKKDKFQGLYNLYFKEFKARCAALQAVKKELGLEPDKVKLDKVPEAQKVEAQEQSVPTAPQQIKQEKEIKTAVQPTTRIVIEEQTNIQQQKEEDKLKYGTPVVKNEEGENDKKFDLPEPKQENVAVNTQKTTEEEPCSSRDTESSNASSTSTNKAPRYKVLERKEGAEDKDAGFETYDVNNQPIDIDDESVKLYNKFLDQVLEEFKKEGKIANIDLIKKKVEEKLFACFSIRDEKGEIISEDNYSDKDKKDIALAKEDYKYTAEHSELIQDRFNAIEEALKDYNKRLAGANKEMGERVLKEQETATASIKM